MKIYLRLIYTQEPLVEDVACAAVDVEPFDLAGVEIDLVDVFRIAYLDVGLEKAVLGVEIFCKPLEGLKVVGESVVLPFGQGLEDALEFASDSMQVAIVMVIDREAMPFGISKYDISAG